MKIKCRFSVNKISCFLKEYYFLILGAILLILFCLNIFIYYQYVYLAMNAKLELVNGETLIDEEAIEKVTGIINEREESLIRVGAKNYSDPFNN